MRIPLSSASDWELVDRDQVVGLHGEDLFGVAQELGAALLVVQALARGLHGP